MRLKLFNESDLWRHAAFFTMVVCCVAFFYIAVTYPIQNWDMLGYAGSVASLSETDPHLLHQWVYEEFRAYATPGDFHTLTQSTNYRQTMFEDADGFVQQIPFYKIRVAFVLLIALMAKLGVNIYDAQHLLSAGFGSAGLFLLFLGLRQYIHSLLWLAVPYFFYQFTQDLVVVRFAGVDSFAFFWVALTLVAYVHKSPLLLPLLACSVLVRTDLILYVGLMYALVFLGDYSKWWLLGIWGAVCAGLYLWVNHWAGNYGWQTVFYFVFMTDMEATHPSEYSQIGVGLQQYLQVLARPQWVSKWLWFSVAASMFAMLLYWYQLRESEHRGVVGRFCLLGLVAIAYVIVHYLLFPVIFMRFFVAQYLVMLMAPMAAITAWWRQSIALEFTAAESIH
jgi:hypothetical protein